MDTETTPTNGTAETAPAEKRKRARLTDTDIANIKVLKSQGKTLKEIADATGFSIGSVATHSHDGTKPKKERKARAPKATPAAAKSTLDTPTAVKSMLFDLIVVNGHPIAAVRGALATYFG